MIWNISWTQWKKNEWKLGCNEVRTATCPYPGISYMSGRRRTTYNVSCSLSILPAFADMPYWFYYTTSLRDTEQIYLFCATWQDSWNIQYSTFITSLLLSFCVNWKLFGKLSKAKKFCVIWKWNLNSEHAMFLRLKG